MSGYGALLEDGLIEIAGGAEAGREKRIDSDTRGTGADLARILDMFCRAFDQDPHINWMVRQDAHRVRAIRDLFGLLLDPARGGQLHATSQLDAAALWFAPEGAGKGISSDLSFFIHYLPIAGWSSAPAKAWRLKRLQAQRPPGPHYYLQLLGVDPASQGQGRGDRLLGELTRRCDLEGVPAYLETSREDNAAYYARHGFRVVARHRLSRQCMLFSMLRAAHPDNR